MATKKSQRIFIWVIAIVMTVGTLAGFVAMILAPQNEKVDQQQQEKDYAEYQKQVEAQALAHAASSKALDGYAAEAFDKASVAELKVETLKQGDGEALTADSTANLNYFGWTSDGKIFDSTNQNGTTTPTDISLSGVIPGWTQGLTGVKAGSTVKLTIPAALGYAEAGSAPLIGPNEPLQFIIEVKELKK